MKKLETIQTEENLNDIFTVDDAGPGGAHHTYIIRAVDSGATILGEIRFQTGPRKEEDSISGVIDSDLLEIVRDRLKAFQAGPYSSEFNGMALSHIEEALNWMNRRVEDRIRRNVLGKNIK